MDLEEAAQLHEAKEWEMRNAARIPEPIYHPSDPGYGPAECVQCDEEMPAQRRAYGYHLCTKCKSALEAKPSTWRHR